MPTTSKGNTQTVQQSQTSPWLPTIGPLSSLVGPDALGGMTVGQNLQNSATENQAAAQFGQNAQSLSGLNYAPQTQALTDQLFAGGGQGAYQDMAKSAYDQYGQQLSPFLQSNYLDPNSNPYTQGLLQQARDDAANNVN